MERTPWFERHFNSGLPAGMLPFYLERLEGTIWRLEHKVNGIAEELLSAKCDDKWSIKQNIGHLAEIDEIGNKRIDEILWGISPMSPAVFEPTRDYNTKPVTEILNFFRENRLKNLGKYKKLTEDDLKKSSLHPRLKVIMTPVDLASFEADHDDHHLVTINSILNRK